MQVRSVGFSVREEMEIKAKNKKKIIYTLLLTLIGLSTSLFYAIFRTAHEVNDEKSIKFINEIDIGKQSIGSFFEIVFFSIFGKLILKNKIYKHHVVSLIIMLFNLILLFTIYVSHFKIETFRIILYYLIYNLLFSLSFCFGKKEMSPS